MHESTVFCSACTMSSLRKFTFAISSPDEFLVSFLILYVCMYFRMFVSHVCFPFYCIACHIP